MSDPVPSKRSKTEATTASSDKEFGSSIIRNAKSFYECGVCDVEFKFKRNVKPYLKSKRHLQASKDAVAVPDERVSGPDHLDEIGFARQRDGKVQNRETFNEDGVLVRHLC